MQERDLIYCICEDCAEEWGWNRKFMFYNTKDICELCGEERTYLIDQVLWEEKMKGYVDQYYSLQYHEAYKKQKTLR